MNSSISNFKRRRSSGIHSLCLAYFLLAFLSLFGVTAAWWKNFAHPAYYSPPALTDLASSREYYPVEVDGYHFDHVAYLDGEAPIMGRLTRAEIVFLGNSRLMFAMPRELIRPYFEGRKLRHHVAGFGHGEQDKFSEILIEKYKIFPRVVVVNAEGFFTGTMSDFGKRLVSMTPFERRKEYFEGKARLGALELLNRFLPHVTEPDLGRNRNPVMFRSRQDGTWLVLWGDIVGQARPLIERTDIDENNQTFSFKSELKEGRRFKAILESRGSRLLLMYVPSPNYSRDRAKLLARGLGVPLLAPRIDRPESFDSSHLSFESAKRFTPLLLDELDKVLYAPSGKDPSSEP